MATNDNRYIIVTDDYGYCNFLMKGNKITWVFSKGLRVFKTLETAKKNAFYVNARVKVNAVRVINLKGYKEEFVKQGYRENDGISCCTIKRLFGTAHEEYTINNQN